MKIVVMLVLWCLALGACANARPPVEIRAVEQPGVVVPYLRSDEVSISFTNELPIDVLVEVQAPQVTANLGIVVPTDSVDFIYRRPVVPPWAKHRYWIPAELFFRVRVLQSGNPIAVTVIKGRIRHSDRNLAVSISCRDLDRSTRKEVGCEGRKKRWREL